MRVVKRSGDVSIRSSSITCAGGIRWGERALRRLLVE